MHAVGDSETFRRALVPLVVTVLLVGIVTLGVGTRSGDAAGGSRSAHDGDAAPRETSPATSAPLGPAVAPAPGVYRYAVDTVHDGEPSTMVEEREISRVGEEGGSSIIEVVARSEDERQVSVLAWSSDGVRVRSTRIETVGGPTQDCTWDPSFTEFGALATDADWAVDARCTASVAGLATEFAVRGTGMVVGEAQVVVAGERVRAWQVVRDRTTTITARIGDDDLQQVVREVGTFFVDPARGLVLRSDVTVTRSGTQQGVIRRTSVLVEG